MRDGVLVLGVVATLSLVVGGAIVVALIPYLVKIGGMLP